MTILAGTSARAQAESFSLTRGHDNRVFTCSDDSTGAVTAPPRSAISCSCRYGSMNFGRVFAGAGETQMLASTCSDYHKEAVLTDCEPVSAPQGLVTCECKYGSSSYGQVAASIENPSVLTSACRRKHSEAKLIGCAGK